MEIIESARNAVRNGKKRILIVAPTGAGKTRILAEKARLSAERGKVVLYIVHRRQLVEQTSAVFSRLGIPHSVIMAGYETDFSERIFIVSRDTWTRRGMHGGFPPDEVGLILYDEAHIAVERQRLIAEKYDRAVVVGYTATPTTLTGLPLGEFYEELIQGPNYVELQRMGFLVPGRYIVPKTLDMEGVRVSKSTNDYVAEDVQRVVKGQVLGDLWDALRQYGNGRTIIFLPSVDIAHSVASELGAAGYPAATLDWSTPDRERTRILEDFRNGRIMALCNVDVLSEGFDEPTVQTIILASPTRSTARYLQRVGRGMRPAPGKAFVTVVDMANQILEHGIPEDYEAWELERGNRKTRNNNNTGGIHFAKTRVCQACGESFKGSRACPKCGWEVPRRYLPAELEVIPADFTELNIQYRDPIEQQKRFYRALLEYARYKGWKDGWAAHMYRTRYGSWPPFAWRNEDIDIPRDWRDVARRWIAHVKIKEQRRLTKVI